ncbi:MAG: GAF domain-containing protein [Chloroflexota bacterium]
MGIVGSLLLAAGVVYVLLPLSTLRWASQPFAGFLLDPNLVINDSGEATWPARQLDVPVAYPERVTAVNGQAVTSNAQFYAILASHEVGDTLSFTLSQPPDGSSIPSRNLEQPTRTIELTLFQIDATSLWNQFWLIYLVGMLCLLIGTWTFLTRPRVEAAQIFALFTVFAALTAGNLFDLVTTQVFIRIWTVSIALAGSMAALLSFVFPHEPRLIMRLPWLRWVVLFPGVLIAVWGQLWLYQGPDPWAYAIPWRVAYLLNIIGLVVAILTTIYRTAVSPSALVRQQGRIVLAGAVMAFTPLILVFISLGFALHWDWLTQAIYVPPVIIYPLAIGYTIIRYRLMDVDMLRQGLSYLIVGGVLVGAFTLIFSGLTTVLGTNAATLSNPFFIAALVTTVILVSGPLRRQLQQRLDPLLFSQPIAFADLLRAYNRELTTAVHVEKVTDTLSTYVQRAIPGSVLHTYLLDAEGSSYVSQAAGQALSVPAASPLVAFMSHELGTIDLAEERTWPPELRAHRDAVHALEASVLAPINNGQELLGWLALGPKTDGNPYTTTELNYLSALADQSLIGLERANVIYRLEMRIADLDVLSRFSQALNFTIELDDLLELVYTNYYRTFGVDDFYVALRNQSREGVHYVFFLEDGERYPEREGVANYVVDERVDEVMRTGQMLVEQTADGDWVAAPLNAGADALGALFTICRGKPFQERQRQLFVVFADRTAVALERLQTNQQLKDRAQQLEIINEVTLTLASTPELDQLLNVILDKAIELLDAEAGTFMLSHEDTGELEFRVVRGPSSQELLGKRLPIGTGLAGRVAQSGRPEIVNQVQADRRWFAEVDANTKFNTTAILTVPMIRHNTVAGVLQVINKRSGAPFTEVDQQLLLAFAGQAVVAMENARLLEQTDKALQDRVNELFLLQQLDRDLNTTLDLDRILHLALDWALRICGGTAGIVVLTNDERHITAQATRGYDADFDPVQLGERKLSGGLIGQVLKNGKPHVTGNVHNEPHYVAGSSSTHSQLTLPIIHQEQLIGVMAIESDQFEAFEPYMLETAVRITTHAAVAITNAILYQQVHEANLAKSEFVSMVSHELKTPMTSMRGYTDLMLSGMTGELTQQQRGFLERIMTNIERMSRQIRDLTDISRIETGRLLIVLEPIAFANVISETLPTVQGLCDQKRIQLQLDLPPDLPLVIGDKERLVQVLTNLLSNACKYSPAETAVTLALRAEHTASDNGGPPQAMVVCSVHDQGYGISEEDQRRLFTKFFRADDPNIRQAPGTGLGLSITKGIVELHGGHVWVESALGEGTTFHFSLPQALPE